MAHLIKPGAVKITTKDGEIQVSLTIDLNLNLNGSGLSLPDEVALNKESTKAKERKEERIEWAIPDFEDAPKINFGKKES